jgi:hypothetical protein
MQARCARVEAFLTVPRRAWCAVIASGARR